MDIVSSFNSSFTVNRLTEEQYWTARNAGEISGYHEFEFYLTEEQDTDSNIDNVE